MCRPSAVDLGVLQPAVFNDRRLRLRYRHGRDRQVRPYTLDPYGLVSKAGAWYLVADHRGRPMMFRSDRMLSASVVEEPVRRRGGVEPADVWEVLREGIDRIPASVRVRRSALARFLRCHEANLATPAPALEEAEAGAGDEGGRWSWSWASPRCGRPNNCWPSGRRWRWWSPRNCGRPWRAGPGRPSPSTPRPMRINT